MLILYTKPELVDLSQGSRIAFARQFRFMTQDDVSDKLGLTGECKRRTMTRYEKGNMTKKQKILLSKIDSFKDHPFHVNNDESLKGLANSIKENGLYTPLTVRLKEDGRYELISGHRRKAAMQLNGIDEIDAVIKELDDDEATIRNKIQCF